LGQRVGIDGIRLAVLHQRAGEIVGGLRVGHHQRHTGVVQGDRQVEVIGSGGFQADEDAGQTDQLLHQTGAIGGGVGEFLRLVRSAVLADDEDQLFRADINSGEQRF
jgi:hypothetical protein